jgi:hypothetical protein
VALPEDNQSNRNVDGDLHWLAFRYAVGELPGDEEAAFERRLAGDQSAREALEQVVELKEAMRIAASDAVREDASSAAAPLAAPLSDNAATPSSQRPSWTAWALAAVTGIALTACLVWLSQQKAQQADDGDSGQAMHNSQPAADSLDDADSASLAAAWAELRSREVLDPAQRAVEWDVEGEDDAVPMPADTDAGGAELPDWLLTAVASENEGDR